MTDDATRPEPIEVVLFDVGGTLLHPEPSVGAVYSRAAAELGHEVPADRLQARFAGAWKESMERSRQRGHTCSREILREEWRTIVTATFDGEVHPAAIPAIFDDLYRRFVSSDAWRLAPGALDALETVRRLGRRLGVLSNWDARLEETLAQLDLARHFDFFVVSCDVGHEKPHPRIFEVALREAGTTADRVLLVGDSWEADVLGAERAGLRALWVTGDQGDAGDRSARASSLSGGSRMCRGLDSLDTDSWREILDGGDGRATASGSFERSGGASPGRPGVGR